MSTLAAPGIAQIFRDQHARAVAVLVRKFGDIDLAEECVQDAFTLALERWPTDGVPPSPAGWIITTARNRALDRMRREASRADRHRLAFALFGPSAAVPVVGEPEDEVTVDDDRLRLIFTCCHPALAPSSQIALTLRLVGGLTTPEIARAFLVPEPTMAQRLVRAKAKIRDATIPFRIPDASQLPARVRSVLAVLYLIFNEGHLSSDGDELSRPDLCREALRLGRLVAELVPDEPEVLGLVALFLFAESRRPARTNTAGELVPLVEQDRSRWDPTMIAEGQALVMQCLERDEPGPYQIQAAISAVHSDASTAAHTSWHQILALYDQLLAFAPSPVAELNRAVVVAELEGPAAALALVDALALHDYYLFHAIRADLLRRLDRTSEASLAYAAAIAGSANVRERAFLERRRSELRR